MILITYPRYITGRAHSWSYGRYTTICSGRMNTEHDGKYRLNCAILYGITTVYRIRL